MSKTIIKQRRSFKKILETRKEVIKRYPAIAGNGAGVLSVPDRNGYIYVTIDDAVYQAASNKISPVYNSQIIVGVSGEDGTKRIYQVLGYAASAMNDANIDTGGKHGHTHEWMRPGGGQDPVRTHLRAFTHLEIGMSPNRGLNIFLFNGIIFNGSNYIAVPSQEIDLTAHVPAPTDKAALVLITIDNNGAVVVTKGVEVDITALSLPGTLPAVIPYMPAKPDNTIWTCGAVRVYNGQINIVDARRNGDFVDLRFANDGSINASDDLFMITEDLTAQITGSADHFDLTVPAHSIPAVYCNVRQLPSAFAMDADAQGFTLSYTPTTYDHLIVDYYATRAALLFDGDGSILADGNNSYLFDL